MHGKAVHWSLNGHASPPEPETSSFVEAAVRTCHERGLNLTPIRRRVLEVVGASAVPVSAYAIVHQLSGSKLLGPPTVYRALEFLEKAGFVRHLALRKAYVRCALTPEAPTSALLLCTDCGSVSEAASREMGEIIGRLAAETGFEPCGRVIEIEGRCAACRDVADG